MKKKQNIITSAVYSILLMLVLTVAGTANAALSAWRPGKILFYTGITS